MTCAVLTACAGAPDPDAAPARFALVPAPGGLDVVGSGGREIGFGRAQAGALESVRAVTGDTPRAVACDSGRDAYAVGDLTLIFEARRFVGWRTAADAAGADCGRTF